MTVSTTGLLAPRPCIRRSRSSAIERGFAASSFTARWKVRSRICSGLTELAGFSSSRFLERRLCMKRHLTTEGTEDHRDQTEKDRQSAIKNLKYLREWPLNCL